MISQNATHLKKRGLALFLSFCLLAFSSLPFSLAWFSHHSQEPSFSADAILGYFDPESGTGKTANDPYIISAPIHFYYFTWLQNIGAFPENEPVFFKIKDGVTVLDMAGALDGAMGKTGAIPPIGSTDNPFLGKFDGNGAVIKNLWVSTDEADWFEKPAEHELYTVGTDVGLFGKVGATANITNFYLENVEITNTAVHTDTQNVNMGIIAGYVDGNISNIGVKNAKISFKDGNTTRIASEYALVGHVTDNVIWDDLPSNNIGGNGGGSGGELLVNPTTDPNATVSSGTKKVDEAVEGTAYYVSQLSATPPSPEISGYYELGYSVSFDGSITSYSAYDSSKTLNDPNGVYADVTGTTSHKIIMPSAAINFTSPVTDENGKTFPGNSIWFKPANPGECAIAFCRQNKSADETMSIFRFQRDSATGKIIESTKQEIVLVMTQSGLKNGAAICFTLNISTEDVENHYEYVIGATSKESREACGLNTKKSGTAGFVFLKLAGTNVNEGPGETAPDGGNYRFLVDIDFVESTDVDLETVDMHRSIIELSGTQANAGALYFDAANGKVVYCNESTLTLTQHITTSPEAQLVTRQEYDFPPRKEVP